MSKYRAQEVAVCKDKNNPTASDRLKSLAFGGGIVGGIAAGIGAAVGSEKTLYAAEPKTSPAPAADIR
ncbi:MAG TPA: hypothetical protein PLA43_18230 [Bryobacteraceae bacterium]|nr:hypothetical protein [Bryobacteraceae bacterium]HOQ47320.1 hypothetical protein [Bryobacteraceae bacterium]HPQ16981.1 hypothetical protein [Bryobacteraceae bacterium]HPU73895.1 hypothetical protein [Bryobacteraceae bacterium]